MKIFTRKRIDLLLVMFAAFNVSLAVSGVTENPQAIIHSGLATLGAFGALVSWD